MKTYFDHKEFKKGELQDAIKKDELELREIRRIEQQSGKTTSQENQIYFREKGEL